MINFEVRIAPISDAEKIIFDPEIYNRIKIDGVEVKELPTKNAIYVGGYLDGEIVSLMMYYIRNKYTTCHVHVLKSHRARLAVKFGRESLLMRPCNALYTNIPSNFPDVIKFAEHFGFKYIGLVNGQRLYGVNYGFC